MPFQTALVTGASSGIGRALALELAARGCALCLSARRQALLEAVAADARRLGVAAHCIPCDVRQRTAVAAAAGRALDAFDGRLDLAVLNAGVAGTTRGDAFDAGAADRILNTNLHGTAYWLEALLPAMLARGAGTLAGVSSMAGVRGLPGVAAYSASKAGLNALLESVRVDVRRRGVRVVTVEPGFVRTPMTAELPWMPFLWTPERAAHHILDRLEHGRMLIRFPWQMALLLHLVRALPISLYDALAARARH